MNNSPSKATGDLLRELGPQVLGALVRRYGDFPDAEDAVQEALTAAVSQWPAEGVPANPRAWLTTVATRRLIDMWRSDIARHGREVHAARHETAEPPSASNVDDSLSLLLLCCHPALPASAAIPLTLRAVGGLTTAEIAQAFLVPEPTMGKRISRAKQRIKDSGEPFGMPSAQQLPGRLRAVLHILYLIFNEGYAASSGRLLIRTDLCADAIRLARMLYAQLPAEPEVAGLLALTLLTDARRPARTGPHGELIALPDQDRQLWDRTMIAEGIALISAALPQRKAGYYQVQAAIAAVHDEAETAEDTDWPQILALYGLLARISNNPMVRLNQAIAAAMVHGPQTGLAMLDRLAGQLPQSHRIDATRAHLLEMAGDTVAAREHYLRAASRTASEAERQYLAARAARLPA